MADQGMTAQFYQGERITDAQSLSVVTAVLAGLANKETTAALIDAGGKAAGISGVDGGLIEGRVRDPKLGYLGDVVQVNPQVLETLLDAGFIPVVSPVSLNADDRQPQDAAASQYQRGYRGGRNCRRHGSRKTHLFNRCRWHQG